MNLELDDTSSVGRDFNDFCEDLEEDPAFRQNVNIYKDSERIPVEGESGDAPQISLQEMFDDMTLQDEPMDDAESTPVAAGD